MSDGWMVPCVGRRRLELSAIQGPPSQVLMKVALGPQVLANLVLERKNAVVLRAALTAILDELGDDPPKE